MYTNQQVRVLCDGVYSLSFSVSTGAIINPIHFCVYLDALLVKLREAGVGCYILQVATLERLQMWMISYY